MLILFYTFLFKGVQETWEQPFPDATADEPLGQLAHAGTDGLAERREDAVPVRLQHLDDHDIEAGVGVEPVQDC